MRFTKGPDVSETYRQQSSFPMLIAHCKYQFFETWMNMMNWAAKQWCIGNTSDTTLYFPVMEALSK